jgi:hypothetical protein
MAKKKYKTTKQKDNGLQNNTQKTNGKATPTNNRKGIMSNVQYFLLETSESKVPLTQILN